VRLRRDLRESAGLKQGDVCQKLNVTQGLISQWETGKGFPRVEFLYTLADLYNCTIDELFDRNPRVS